MALLQAETGCTVDWRPVNGGDIRKLRRRGPFEGEPVSGQYDWSYRERDARLWADYYGIGFREPPSHHLDFGLLARAATAAKRLGRAADYGWRICTAVYGTDTWPIDETVCIALAEEIGFAADLFRATLEDPESESLPRPRKRLSVAARLECRHSLSVRRCSGATTGSRSSSMFSRSGPCGRNRSASPLSSHAQSLFLRHLVVAQRDRPAALRSLDWRLFAVRPERNNQRHVTA